MALNEIRVLLAEDEPLVAMLLEDALTDAGACVLGPAMTLAHGLELAGQGPDVALLDLRLGRESAAPIADALAALGIPFAIMSGDVGVDPLPRHGRVPSLAKPFEPDQAVRLLARMVGRG